MPDIVINALIGIVSIGIGYLVSRHQNIELIKAAKQLLRASVPISLRDEFHMTHILADYIQKDSFRPDLIVAVAPGGAMIGEWLSRRFIGNKASPIPICVLWMHVKRDSMGRHLSAPRASAPLGHPSVKAKRVLIVNDISRTGRTLEAAVKAVKEMLPDSLIKVAVLFLSEDAGPPYPDYWVDKPSRRVVFEWKQGRA